MESRNWIEAKPCPICGKSDWCSIAKNGMAVVCARVQEGSLWSSGHRHLHLLFGTPPNPQHGREPDKVKPLAQYLAECLENKHENIEDDSFAHSYPDGSVYFDNCRLEAILKQALNAYQSTENVTIKIERV